MDKFAEIHESPATAQASDNMSQAAATMSNPASQIMFKEASATAGNTAHSFLPNLAIDGAQALAQANPRQAALDFDSYAYLKNQEQHGSVRKYDNSSFGIGLGEGDFE